MITEYAISTEMAKRFFGKGLAAWKVEVSGSEGELVSLQTDATDRDRFVVEISGPNKRPSRSGPKGYLSINEAVMVFVDGANKVSASTETLEWSP